MPSLSSWSNENAVNYGSTVTPSSGHILEALLEGWVPKKEFVAKDTGEDPPNIYEMRLVEPASGAYVAWAKVYGENPVDPIPFALAVIKSVLIGVNQRHELLTKQLTDQEAKLKATNEALAESVAAVDALTKKLDDLARRVGTLED